MGVMKVVIMVVDVLVIYSCNLLWYKKITDFPVVCSIQVVMVTKR